MPNHKLFSFFLKHERINIIHIAITFINSSLTISLKLTMYFCVTDTHTFCSNENCYHSFFYCEINILFTRPNDCKIP